MYFVNSSKPLTSEQSHRIVEYCFQRPSIYSTELTLRQLAKMKRWAEVADLAIGLSTRDTIILCSGCNILSDKPICCGEPIIVKTVPKLGTCKFSERDAEGQMHAATMDTRLIPGDLTRAYRSAELFMEDPRDTNMFQTCLGGTYDIVIINHFLLPQNIEKRSPYQILQTAIVAKNILQGKIPHSKKEVAPRLELSPYDCPANGLCVNNTAIKQYKNRLKVDKSSTQEVYQYWSERLTSWDVTASDVNPQSGFTPDDVNIDDSALLQRQPDNYPSLSRLLSLLWIDLNEPNAEIPCHMLMAKTFLVKKNDCPDLKKQRLIAVYPTLVNMVINKHLATLNKHRGFEKGTRYVRCDENNQYWILDGKDSYYTIDHGIAKRLVKDYPYLVKLIEHPLHNFCNTGMTIVPKRGLMPGLALSVNIFELIMEELKKDLPYNIRYVDDVRIFNNIPTSLSQVEKVYAKYGLQLNYSKFGVISVESYYIDTFCKRPIVVLASNCELTETLSETIDAKIREMYPGVEWP